MSHGELDLESTQALCELRGIRETFAGRLCCHNQDLASAGCSNVCRITTLVMGKSHCVSADIDKPCHLNNDIQLMVEQKIALIRRFL